MTDQELLARIDKGFNRAFQLTQNKELEKIICEIFKALRVAVELKLGDDKYPTDIFPELTDTDKENLKEVHQLFPNLIGRVDASACRRAFGIAEREVKEAIEKELG